MTDFPATTVPGVVVIPNNPSVTHPTIAPDLIPIIKVTGVDLTGIRVSYSAADDVMSIGLEQPASQQPGQPGPVIAGDVDNNGNDGTVSPDVLAVRPAFEDYPDFGGSEYMGIFLDLNGDSLADVVAGYALNDTRSPKQYQVAEAVNLGPPGTTEPVFGAELPQFTGNVYKVNSPAHPNLEFAIDDFSKLYLQETGKTLSADTKISIGAFAGAQEANGIGKAYFPEQEFTLGRATIPPDVCPPVSPPVMVNPHLGNHVNTAHAENVRVSIFGSSGFDVTKIDPGTVRFGGAAPKFGFDRFINRDGWLDATFVFKGTDITLPPGFSLAPVTGQLADGTTFSSSVRVFNRDRSFYSPAQNRTQQRRQHAAETWSNGFSVVPESQAGVVTPRSAKASPVAASGVKVDYDPAIATPRPAAPAKGPVVKIQRRDASDTAEARPISRRMQSNIDRMARQRTTVAAGNAGSPY